MRQYSYDEKMRQTLKKNYKIKKKKWKDAPTTFPLKDAPKNIKQNIFY